MSSRTIAIFFLCLFVFTPFSMAVPYLEEIQSSPLALPIESPVLSPPEKYAVLTFQAAPDGTGSTCQVSSLSPEEVQRFKDTILTPGLVGNEISAGTNPNTDRERVSDQNTLLVPNPFDKESAFQKEIPTQILQPEELSPLQNQHVKGPFAFGVSLDDSLRAAKCGKEEACAVYGEKLQLRNSGEGIVGNVKDMYNAVVKDLDSPESKFSEEEADYVRAQIQTEQDLGTPDANHIPIQTYERKKNDILMNHIRLDNTFQAGMLTNCAEGDCILTLYSMFDKYFNSWFSGELVVSTFAPTLWGRFNKMLRQAKRQNLVTAKFVESFNLKKAYNARRVADRLEGRKLGDTPIAPSEFFERVQVGAPSTPGEPIGISVLRNYKRFLSEEQDFRQVTDEFFTGPNPVVLKAGGYSVWEGQAFNPDGKLSQIKDLDRRKKIFSYVGKLKEYADVTNELHNQTNDLYKAAAKILKESTDPASIAEAQKLRTQAARQWARIFRDFDDFMNTDIPDLVRKDFSTTGFDQLYIRPAGAADITPFSIGTGDLKFQDEILDEFAEKGNFLGVKRAERAINPATGRLEHLQLYKAVSQKEVGIVDLDVLARGGYPSDIQVRLNSGLTVGATPGELERVKQDFSAFGQLPRIVKTGYEKAVDAQGRSITLSPEVYADHLLSGEVWPRKVGTAARNINSLYDTMTTRDWGRGRYTNILSKSLQTQDSLIKNYFNIINPDVLSSGIGWTAKMYGYWWLTRGFGSDKFSIYQLPQEWTEVQFYPGESEFYDDAYIDFFANEGSDTGDLFQRVISKLPVPLVLDQFAGQYPTLQKAWDFINGGQVRTSPDNLATYMFGAESCPTCSATLVSPQKGRFDVDYHSPESMNTFFIEHGKSKDAKEKGQYLLSFAHKTNIKGQIRGDALEEVDLIRARQEKKTCEQVAENLFLYGPIAKVIGAEKAGAAIALTESLTYFGGGLAGAFVTFANQLAYAPQFNECVDDKEGYFSGLFVPVEVEKKGSEAKADELQKSVSENALDGIREFATKLEKENPNPSLPDKVLKEATSKVKELVDEAQQNRVAEAELRISGSSSGYLRSKEVIYFWSGGNSRIEPTRYLTEGKTVIIDQNGHTITLDNKEGTLTVDGQLVIGPEHADHERLANKNMEIPAVEIPQRLNSYGLPLDANYLLVSVNVRGEAIVQDPVLLDCIQQAVLEQSAVPLNSNNMSEAFGNTESVVTDAYPNIVIDPIKNRILLGGQAPQTASGPTAAIHIFANREVIVTGAPNPSAGKFQSMLLENGSMIYKPQTNELIIWLRHHAQAVVKDTDVKNFAGKLTTTQNENTDCEEPAIELNVETDPSTPATKLKGDNLTAGLKKNGPFQVFETDSKRFILYSKLVDGVCKQFFKVINKNTGEVYDQEIKEITQGEDGKIHIKTADGKNHTLEFSDQNGKPVITYDGNSELLRSAMGKGGSFYYDPNKGIYVAENAQLIPLNDNFKNQGISFQANPDGTVSGKPGDNVFVINPPQGGQGLFNIPSIPENVAGAGIVILLLGLACAGLYMDNTQRKKRKSALG